jgi:hypothetical protein
MTDLIPFDERTRVHPVDTDNAGNHPQDEVHSLGSFNLRSVEPIGRYVDIRHSNGVGWVDNLAPGQLGRDRDHQESV